MKSTSKSKIHQMPLEEVKLPELSMPEPIRQFLETLLSDAGLEESASELKLMMMNDLFADLQNKLFLSLSQAFTEDQLETYERMAGVDQNQAMIFARETLPDLDGILNRAMAEFRQSFLNER